MSRLRTILLASALAAVAPIARADEPTGAADRASPAYTLEVDSDDPDAVSFEALAARIQAELGAPVVRASQGTAVRAAIVVRYRSGARTLGVRAVHTGGRVVERTVEATGDTAAVQREAVLLAGNLARDEARELIDALAARPPQAEPPVTESPAEPTNIPPPNRDRTPEEPRRIATFALAYPIATNRGEPDVGTHLDLSFFYGRVGRVDGAQLGLGVVHASRPVHGMQGGLVASVSDQRVYGVQGSIGLAWARGGVNGLLGGIGASLANEPVDGMQGAAGANVALARVRGTQFAPGANVSKEIEGAQVAGGANVSGDVTGAQVAVVNVARKVRGVQVGVVNVAEEVDGAAIGLVSITRDGIHPIAWAGNLSYTNVGVKFATKYVYTITAFSMGTPELGYADSAGGTLALGAHVPLPASFDLEVEGAVSEIASLDVRRDANDAVHVRALAGHSFAPHFRLFAGGGARIPFDYPAGRPVVRPEAVAGVQF